MDLFALEQQKTPLWITKISGHSGALVRVLVDNLGTLESYMTDKRATKPHRVSTGNFGVRVTDRIPYSFQKVALLILLLCCSLLLSIFKPDR